jgi:hypothetical protein
LSEPIPVLYGRHLVYPDLAASPYTEYANNEQYLYQLFCIGQGFYDTLKIRIEDTPIASFEEVNYELVQPDQLITLFNPNVVTAAEVAGQELLCASDGGSYVGGFIANPAETIITKIGIDTVFPKGLYYANDSGGLNPKTRDAVSGNPKTLSRRKYLKILPAT